MTPDPRDVRIAELERKVSELMGIIAEKDRIIGELRKTIEEWRRGHRVRPRRGSRKMKAGERKRPGRKKGHEAARRKMPDKADRTVPRTKESCDHCQGSLTPTGNSMEQLVENVVPARVEVEKNVLYEYRCDCCGELQWSELPAEYGPLPVPGQPMLSPEVRSMALELRYDMGLSFPKIVRHFGNLGLNVTAGGIYKMLERAAQRTAPVYEEIRERAQMSPYVNMDETSHWEDGERLWAWIVSNLELSLFHIDRSRGHKVIEKLLCEVNQDGEVVAPYEGTVVSDFMGAYCTCEWMVHQFCWSHLLRDADKEAELDPCLRTDTFRARLHDIYHDALIAQAAQDKGKKHGIRVRLGRLIADPELGEHPDVARLQGRAFTEFHGLLRFLDEPGLPAHNNQGELDVRSLVLMRKVLYGTRSPGGTRTHAHFMSLSQTARKQGVNLGGFVTQALSAYHSGAPPPSIFPD